MNDHIHPNIETDSELLSAYLDDELTDDERVVVEQALENSPPLRESLQELKLISHEMQWLAVEFHPNEQQLINTVITKIRDRNLSVHGQAPYSNAKIPVMTKSWKQRLQIPALLTLTAGVLAVLTLPFIPSEQSTTLVQTDQHDTIPSAESSYQAENGGREFTAAEADTDLVPMDAMEGGMRDERAHMGGLGGRRSGLGDERYLQENNNPRYNTNRQADVESAGAHADQPAAPAETQARPFPTAGAMASSEDKLLLRYETADNTDVADITYHIQVKQKTLPALLALLTTHQNLAQNMPQKKVAGFAAKIESIAEEPPHPVVVAEAAKNNVRKSEVHQIVMLRATASQLEALLRILQQNPDFALSMNHLQRGALGSQLMEKNKDTPRADTKHQSAAAILSDTIFSIQVIATP
jgi:anti-sigma factor RsiW